MLSRLVSCRVAFASYFAAAAVQTTSVPTVIVPDRVVPVMARAPAGTRLEVDRRKPGQSIPTHSAILFGNTGLSEQIHPTRIAGPLVIDNGYPSTSPVAEVGRLAKAAFEKCN